jgi:hypothetical protein
MIFVKLVNEKYFRKEREVLMNYLKNLPEKLFPLWRYELSDNLVVFLSKLKFKRSSLSSEIDLPETYTVKPVVLSITNKITFPELAVVDILRNENWDAYWIDNFHQKVWNKFPERGSSVELPKIIKRKMDKIKKHLNTRTFSGCWDIVAFKNDIILFLECKGKPSNDKISDSQIKWITTGMKCGIPNEHFFIVEWDFK